MNSTGMIIRRNDETGEIVLPAEVFQKPSMKGMDKVEIFIAEDGSILLKKYINLEKLKKWATEVINKYGDNILTIECLNEKVIHITTWNRNSSATCYKYDEYDFSIGVAVALSKIYNVPRPSELEGRK